MRLKEVRADDLLNLAAQLEPSGDATEMAADALRECESALRGRDEMIRLLLSQLVDTTRFMELHSNRWDGASDAYPKHPVCVMEDARSAIAAATALVAAL